MPDVTLPVQVAVVAALRGSGALTGIVGSRIYDRAPANAAAPYALLSGWTADDEGVECGEAARVAFAVDCYSAEPGREQVAEMAGAVKSALHRLEASGLEIMWQGSVWNQEKDGLTHRASCRFEALADG